jgi:hypothetical protein
LKNEHEISDYHLATLMQYAGIPCISCRVSGQDVTWVFRCPFFDVESVKEELANQETTVVLSAFIKAMAAVSSFRSQARRSLDGQWRSEKYARA